jgi:hypothetical protein
MRSSVLDADVNELCIRIMKRLIEKTHNDENISVNKNTIFEEVHDTSSGIHAFESDNNTLRACFSRTPCQRSYHTRQ